MGFMHFGPSFTAKLNVRSNGVNVANCNWVMGIQGMYVHDGKQEWVLTNGDMCMSLNMLAISTIQYYFF